MVSVIIPTYNEERFIEQTLESLRRVRGNFEVIVVDGESTDGTRSCVEALISNFPQPLRLVTTERPRALQLNRAACIARGGTLLFVHADALVPAEAIESLESTLESRAIIGGSFSLAYDGESLWSRFFTWANRARRSFGIYYGDSGLFVRREAFRRLGGFKPISILDDYEFVRRMERSGRTACLEPVLVVSDRRWRVQGVVKTLSSWVWVQALYSLGLPPNLLARWYMPVRDGKRTL
jgi:rSAM/selenodomain-associated transferase 2